jgi:uncharacterized protein with FMN-binding domain
MKRITQRAIALGLLLALWGCVGLERVVSAGPYTPGQYEGLGRGFRGEIAVVVELDQWGVISIEIISHTEDEANGGAAMEELRELALGQNSAELDCIAGATESSEGFLAALRDALEKGRRL